VSGALTLLCVCSDGVLALLFYAEIKRFAEEMNAGEMFPLFAGMLTRKP
jgi:hypothetical protein